MEMLDYYDENGKYLGFASREEVHAKGLWHNTVHCWLYNTNGEVFFQIRKDTNTLYTTASGHVAKGEKITEAFQREIKEEIGLNIDSSDAILVDIVIWKMDKIKKDGSVFSDRAKANVYIDLYEGNYDDFDFDENEVLGIVLVDAKKTKDLFENGKGSIKGKRITKQGMEVVDVSNEDFLVNEFETAIGKYGKILDKIIELTNKDIK